MDIDSEGMSMTQQSHMTVRSTDWHIKVDYSSVKRNDKAVLSLTKNFRTAVMNTDKKYKILSTELLLNWRV